MEVLRVNKLPLRQIVLRGDIRLIFNQLNTQQFALSEGETFGECIPTARGKIKVQRARKIFDWTDYLLAPISPRHPLLSLDGLVLYHLRKSEHLICISLSLLFFIIPFYCVFTRFVSSTIKSRELTVSTLDTKGTYQFRSRECLLLRFID